MPKYFFHLVDGKDVVLDPDGVHLAAAAVPGSALFQARDCIAGDVKNGRLDLHYHINVHDEAGELVHSLSFKDALEVAQLR